MAATPFAREFFTQHAVPAGSPLIIPNMGRYENISFAAGAVTAVEGSLDYGDDQTEGTWHVITGLGTTFTAGIAFKGVCFKAYRVTFTGSLNVNAN